MAISKAVLSSRRLANLSSIAIPSSSTYKSRLAKSSPSHLQNPLSVAYRDKRIFWNWGRRSLWLVFLHILTCQFTYSLLSPSCPRWPWVPPTQSRCAPTPSWIFCLLCGFCRGLITGAGWKRPCNLVLAHRWHHWLTCSTIGECVRAAGTRFMFRNFLLWKLLWKLLWRYSKF